MSRAPVLLVGFAVTNRAVCAQLVERGHQVLAVDDAPDDQARRYAAELGVDLVVEIGPRSVLAPMAMSAWPPSAAAQPPAVIASQRAPSGEGPRAVVVDDVGEVGLHAPGLERGRCPERCAERAARRE